MRRLLILTVACALYAADVRPAKAPPAKLSDAQIETAIRGKFAKSKIAVNQFTVRVQGGVATIEGSTGVLQHKGTATRLAKSGGATAVNNRVRVSAEARQNATKNLEQGRRRAQVQRGEPRSTPPAEAPPAPRVPRRPMVN